MTIHTGEKGPRAIPNKPSQRLTALAIERAEKALDRAISEGLPTCALDVADLGSTTRYSHIGGMMGLHRESVRLNSLSAEQRVSAELSAAGVDAAAVFGVDGDDGDAGE